MRRHRPFDQLLDSLSSSSLSRRDVLRKALYLGLTAPVVTTLLAACGDDDDVVDTAAPADDDDVDIDDDDEPADVGDTDGRMGGELIIGRTNFQTFDPHVSSSLADTLFNYAVYDRLMELTPDGTYHPGLSTHWEQSEDGHSWTFHLREGVTFHDGTPFDAEAVKYNFERIVDPATRSQNAVFELGPYVDAEVIDDYTLEATWDEVYTRLPAALIHSSLSIVSPAQAQELGENYGQHPVGTGPFIFEEWVENSHITIVRNPDYNWAAPLHLHEGPAYLDRVTFQIIGEPGTLTAALLSGQIHAAANVTAVDWKGLSEDEFTTYSALTAGYPPASYMMNTQNPPTDDINVRKAIAHALDFDGINAAIYDDTAQPAHGILSTFDPYYNEEAYLYPFDIDQANALLDESDWEWDGDYRYKDGEQLSIEDITHTGLRDLAEAVQANMLRIGMNVNITAQQYPAYQEDVQNGIHNIAWLQFSGVDPSNLHKVFHSENIGVGWNLNHFADPELDGLLDEGNREGDPDLRREIYNQVQMIIAENALVAPLNNHQVLYAFQKGLQNVDANFVSQGSWPLLYDIYWES
jgi:peptide/nickel transport system substrate-binding protein